MGRHVVAEFAALNKRNRLEKEQIMFASLLGADLEDLACFLDSIADAKAFLESERQRLLALHVAARL